MRTPICVDVVRPHAISRKRRRGGRRLTCRQTRAVSGPEGEHPASFRGAFYDHPMFRTLRLCLAVLITAAAFLGAVRLTVPADGAHGVRKQLAFLKGELRDGAASRAQGDFPEGYFFLYALYGLTEVDLGLASPSSSRADELREARWALAALSTAEGREPFASPDVPLPYGVFCRGWVNWLRGGILSLQP